MTAVSPPPHSELRAAYNALGAHLGLIAVLLAAAASSWWWTADEMSGMDAGPWTQLGTFTWFIGVWVVMMAAMMFPSISPTVALYARVAKSRSPISPYAFVGGYLLTWAAAGVAAFSLGGLIGALSDDALSWHRAGRWVAGGTLLFAAVYELTPLKDVCLGRCRSPLGFLLGSWRDGTSGALRMGIENGAWCVGCCWALMASLFALGIMSITWMAVIAALIAFQKTIPWRRVATYGTTAVLVVLGVVVLVAPSALPGLTTPGAATTMSPM